MFADQWISAAGGIPAEYRGPGAHGCVASAEFVPFDPEHLDQPIVARFQRIAQHHPGKTAVSDGRLSLTYDQLRRAAFHLAHRINELVPPTRPIMIVLPQSALFSVAALACLAAGRPFAPLDRSYPRARNAKVLREVGAAAAIIARSDEADELGLSLPCIDIASSLGATENLLPLTSDPDDPALILFTSGSTGDPKGICNAQRALLQRVFHATNSCHIHSDDRLVLLSSFCTIAGVRETFSALLNGATLHVTDPSSLGFSGVLRILRDAQITIGYAVPALLRHLMSAPASRNAFSSFRLLRVGGDIPLQSDLELIRRVAPRSSTLIAFSSTEVPTIFQWFVPPDWQPDCLRLPIGFVQPGFEFAVHDASGCAVPVGKEGELVVRSRYLALGYWQNGRLQQGPFIRDAKDRSKRILQTGDMIRIRPDSLVEMLGRKDLQIKMRGYRVNPAELEAVLRGSPSVADAAVIARRAGEEVTALVAFVVPARSGSDDITDTLKSAIDRQLPSYMRPIYIRTLHEIPKLSGFKADLQKLVAIDQQAIATAADQERPVGNEKRCDGGERLSHVRHAVAAAWATVLNRSSLEADLAWDDAGGDSLAALLLWFMIEEALGPVPLETFQPQMTPTALMQAISRQLAARSSVVAADQPKTPLVFLMPPYDGDFPQLMRFRTALEGRVRFCVIRYPGWPDMIKAPASFALIVDAALAQILPRLEGRPCALAGYSFGGAVAWETAGRLRELGHEIEFVGLIDTARSRELLHPQISLRARAERFLSAARSSPGAIRHNLFQMVARVLSRRHCSLLTVLSRSSALMPTRLALAFQWHLTAQLRLRALDQWSPTPLDLPVTLFRSDEHRQATPDFGWAGMCGSLTIVPIGGTHVSILEPPHLKLLCDRFDEAVTRHPHLTHNRPVGVA